MTQRRNPRGIRVDGQGVDSGGDRLVVLDHHRIVRVVAFGCLDHLPLVAGRVDPQPQPVVAPAALRYGAHALIDEAAHRPAQVRARQNRHNVGADGNGLIPRSVVVAGSASNARSHKKSPPAKSISVNAR